MQTAAEAFDSLAHFYDHVTAYHRYDEWMASLERIALDHGLAGKRLLDVGCGTGKSFMPMVKRGYDVMGCDVSAGMLAEARRKTGGRVPLLELDMRELPPLGPFDLVTCIDEPLNYLLDPDDLLPAFRSAARCLRPGGIYLFDLNTLLMYRTAFATEEDYRANGWLLRWRGLASPAFEPGDACVLEVDGIAPDGSFYVTTQTERHHPRPVVESHLSAAGLELLAVYGQHMDGRQDPYVDDGEHTKAIYVARR